MGLGLGIGLTDISMRGGGLFPSLNLQSDRSFESYPLVNFTRSSTKTYFDSNGVLQTASANTLPVGYEYNSSSGLWEKKGWLIEESRENLILDSRDLTTGNWGGTATVTRDETGIDGVNNTACTVTDSNGSGFDSSFQSITVSNDGSTYSGFCFFKKDNNESRFARAELILIGGSTFVREGVHINTKTGSVYERFSDGSYEIEDYQDWWRIRFTITNNTSGNTELRFQIYPAVSTVISSEEPVATGSVIVDQVQVEQGSFASSPIITEGSQVTRSADVADITDLSWYNQDEGTFVVEYQKNDNILGSRVLDINDGTSQNRILINSIENQAVISDGNVTQVNIDGANSVGEKKGSLSFAENDVAFVLDGTILGTDSSATIPTVNKLHIGDAGYSTSLLNGYIKSLKYYNKRLSNSKLQSLTS